MDEPTRALVLEALEAVMIEIDAIENAMEVPKGMESQSVAALHRMIIEKLQQEQDG